MEQKKYMKIRLKMSHKQLLGDLTEMPGLNDPSCAYEIFVGKYTTIYDKC